MDNAIVLRDPESFILLVMGKEIETQVSVNDGEWHHVAVTWSSASGSFVSYQDGLKIAEGTNFQMGQVRLYIMVDVLGGRDICNLFRIGNISF